ncbi:MAG TPA: flagellar basal body protein, partial [Clostridia bacterium]|nr:flagellar basal body protein [Clostridia bacterium]
MSILSKTDVLKSGLDAAWLRNEVIMNNIANAETPGFKASKVEF